MPSMLVTLPGLLLAGVGGSDKFDLPFNDINLLIVTDTHSWISGHKHEPQFDATYGDLLSFHERLQADCDENKKDFFFVMNGDINDGTGVSTDPPIELVPLLEYMPWDAVTVGNHELYKNDFIDYLDKPGGFIDHFGLKYVTSNVIHADTAEPLGGQYHHFLKGKHGSTVLVLGFLYNMTDHDSHVKVLPAWDVVQNYWFTSVVQGCLEDFDAIVVLAHMDYEDPEATVILNAIRALQPDVPVQFVTGHSHHRRYKAMDNFASSFEAGNYMNTVGFASFPTMKNAAKNTSTALARGFQHVFIDPNVQKMSSIAGVDNLATPNGTALTQRILQTKEEMNLTHRLGCAPKTYQMYSPLNESDSLWRTVLDGIIVQTLFQGNISNRVFVQSTGSLRYNLYEGNVTKDDIVTMCPFADEFWLLSDNVAGSVVAQLLEGLNKDSHYALKKFVNTDFDATGSYELYGGSYDIGTPEKPGGLLTAFQSLMNKKVTPLQRFVGKTTTNLWYEFVPANWSCDEVAIDQVVMV